MKTASRHIASNSGEDTRPVTLRTRRRTKKTIAGIIVLAGVMMLLVGSSFSASAATGTVVFKNIPAPSLGNNLLETPTAQEIAIYLPPAYATTEKRYPVLYFLSYYNGTVGAWTDGTLQGFSIGSAMDHLLSGGEYQDMMVVIISGRNILGGGLYVNSPVSGNWEDFVVKDVVGYIDSTYRTLPRTSSRGLGGFSIGGFGALNIGMHHPDIFSVVYGMSPNLFAPNGLTTSALFKGDAFINQFITKEPQLNTLSALKTYIAGCFDSWDIDTPFAYAYGVAFSPDTSRAMPHIAYPYTRSGTTLIKNDELWARYEHGFGSLEEKIQTWGDSLRHLKHLTIEYGIYDEYSWVPDGCRYFSQLLTAANIPHELVSFPGGHGDQVCTRMETVVLPCFLRNLAPETTSGVTDDRESNATHPGEMLPVNTFPNPFNPSATIRFTLSEPGFTTLSIYAVTGQKVRDLLADNLSAGIHTVTWDGRDSTGTVVASGIYYSMLTRGKAKGVGEMMLIR